MTAPPTRPDDVVLVSREHLCVLLTWAAHEPSDAIPMNAQAQLEAELMAPEPPDDWFTDDEPRSSRRRALAITALVLSVFFAAGLGIAWLLLVVTGL